MRSKRRKNYARCSRPPSPGPTTRPWRRIGLRVRDQQQIFRDSQGEAQPGIGTSKESERDMLRLGLWSKLRVRSRVRHAPLWQWEARPSRRPEEAEPEPGEAFVPGPDRGVIALGRRWEIARGGVGISISLEWTAMFAARGRTEPVCFAVVRYVCSSTGPVPSSWGPRDGADVQGRWLARCRYILATENMSRATDHLRPHS